VEQQLGVKVIQGGLSTFLWWKVLRNHLVHFPARMGRTELQHASLTIQEVYLNINYIRGTAWLCITRRAAGHRSYEVLMTPGAKPATIKPSLREKKILKSSDDSDGILLDIWHGNCYFRFERQ
jgi:hypothetical protein